MNGRQMLIPTLIIGVMVLVAVYFARQKGLPMAEGVHSSLWLTLEILPLLLMAFFLAAILPDLLPKEQIQAWVGREAGMRGILIGTLAGALTPGGPFVSFPLVFVLMKGGASVGTLVAFVTSWGTLGINRLPIEIGVVGWRFTAIRYVCSLVLPFLAGTLARLLFRGTHLS